MGTNRTVSDLSTQGARAQDLLDDRIEPLDGMVWFAGPELARGDALTTATITRDGAGLFKMASSTAGTYRFLVSATRMARRREGGSLSKGIKVIDFEFHYDVAAGATVTVDVLIQRTAYAHLSSPSSSAVAFSYDANSDTAGERATANTSRLLTATITDPVYELTNNTWLSAELTVVLTAGAFSVNGGGYHFAHDHL